MDFGMSRVGKRSGSGGDLVLVPLSDVRPSISRNDVLAGGLIRGGIDARRVAQELERALSAEYLVKRWEKVGGSWIAVEVMQPDWRTRMLAIEKIIKVQGWEYLVERLPEGSVPRDLLVIYKELRVSGLSVEELQERHRRDVGAGLVEAVVEVVGGVGGSS